MLNIGAVIFVTSSIIPPPKNAGLVVFGFELKLIKFSVLFYLVLLVLFWFCIRFDGVFIISVYDEKWCQNGDLVTKAVNKTNSF